MTAILVRKLFRDCYFFLIVVAVLLFAFEGLWARVTFHVRVELLGETIQLFYQEAGKSMAKNSQSLLSPEAQELGKKFQDIAFNGPGQIVKSLIGGESIDLMNVLDMMSIGYVHPLVQIILCIWAIGRGAGAISGELDRGTMELLLAQPVPRSTLIVAHLWLDLLTIPIIVMAMFLGTVTGVWIMGMMDPASSDYVNIWRFLPALPNIALLIFAIGGVTIWLSSMGRSRNKTMGFAVILILVMFLINVLAGIWQPMQYLQPFTLFYYYTPQPIIIDGNWLTSTRVWLNMVVLLSVGMAGYGLACYHFTRRDLPAPL